MPACQRTPSWVPLVSLRMTLTLASSETSYSLCQKWQKVHSCKQVIAAFGGRQWHTQSDIICWKPFLKRIDQHDHAPHKPIHCHIPEKNKHNTHTQLRGAKAAMSGTSKLILQNRSDLIVSGLIVIDRSNKSSASNSSLLPGLIQTRSAKKGKSKEDTQMEQLFRQVSNKGTKNKKRISPCSKQWCQCRCGRLYCLWIGLCDCTKIKASPTKSKQKITTKECETTMPCILSKKNNETKREWTMC